MDILFSLLTVRSEGNFVIDGRGVSNAEKNDRVCAMID